MPTSMSGRIQLGEGEQTRGFGTNKTEKDARKGGKMGRTVGRNRGGWDKNNLLQSLPSYMCIFNVWTFIRFLNIDFCITIVFSGSQLEDWQPLPFPGGFDFRAHIEGRKTVICSVCNTISL